MSQEISLKLTPEMIDYTFSQFAQRIGIPVVNSLRSFQEQTGIRIGYDRRQHNEAQQPNIHIRRCSEDAFGSLLSASPDRLHWIPAKAAVPSGQPPPIKDSLPVIIWGAGCEGGDRPFVEQSPSGNVIINGDIIAGSFFMLSRWEEMVVPTRDAHDRFPATASVAFKQKFLYQPVVDQYAAILGAWVQHLKSTIELQQPAFSVKLSHDIDKIEKYPASETDQIKPLPRPSEIDQVTRHESDPYLAGIMKLAGLAEQSHFRSTFYLMTAGEGKKDQGYYERTAQLQHIIDTLRERGHEIGFHPGYETYNHPEIFFNEKKRMDVLLGHTHYGGRQHFLRFQVPHTWRLWESAGLAYDSTLGYEHYYGFRCGTCHPYRPFDIPENREMNILEIPLIVMGFTLNEMRDYSPEESAARILHLALRCKEVNGVFTLLWHNTSFGGDWQPYVDKYQGLLPVLKEMESQG